MFFFIIYYWCTTISKKWYCVNTWRFHNYFHWHFIFGKSYERNFITFLLTHNLEKCKDNKMVRTQIQPLKLIHTKQNIFLFLPWLKLKDLAWKIINNSKQLLYTILESSCFYFLMKYCCKISKSIISLTCKKISAKFVRDIWCLGLYDVANIFLLFRYIPVLDFSRGRVTILVPPWSVFIVFNVKASCFTE